jgi:hypothetical protein
MAGHPSLTSGPTLRPKEPWLRRVVHPYLRFTDEHGRTTRGRTKVIAVLRMTERLETPEEVRLRGGQVYLRVCRSS